MKGINLPGMAGGASNDTARRHGAIHFTLNTVELTSSTPMPKCMYSDVKIVFKSKVRGGVIINSPITGSDLVRRSCKPADPCNRAY